MVMILLLLRQVSAAFLVALTNRQNFIVFRLLFHFNLV